MTQPDGFMVVRPHIQKVTHSYLVHYPEHEARRDDPHYADFHHFRESTKAAAKCLVGEHRNDYSECYPPPEHWPIGLEVHHSHIEFALQNGVDLAWLEVDYPGISDSKMVGAWVESAANLEWRCVRHHRGDAGVHTVTASDYEGVKYVKGLTSTVANLKGIQ
jgi:hypothetical protein